MNAQTWNKSDFDHQVGWMLRCHPDWRKGQAMFNVLYDLDPELADMIRSSKFDPFLSDKKIPAFEAELWG